MEHSMMDSSSKPLNFVSDFRPWKDTVQEFLSGRNPVLCPLCKKSNLEVTAVCGADRIGFLSFTCSSCGKSFHLSRVKFPSFIETETF